MGLSFRPKTWGVSAGSGSGLCNFRDGCPQEAQAASPGAGDALGVEVGDGRCLVGWQLQTCEDLCV